MDDAVPLAHLPHHDGSPLYIEEQHPALGQDLVMRMRVPATFGTVASVHVRSNPNREPRFAEATLVASADGWDWWEATVEVENPVHHYRWLIVTDDGRQHWLNARGLSRVETLDSEDFRLVAGADAPDWAAESVLYQVFPDRFARSDAADARETPDWAIAADWGDPVDTQPPGRSKQFYGGDLDGVREQARPPRRPRREPALPHPGLPRRGPTTATTRRASHEVDDAAGRRRGARAPGRGGA